MAVAVRFSSFLLPSTPVASFSLSVFAICLCLGILNRTCCGSFGLIHFSSACGIVAGEDPAAEHGCTVGRNSPDACYIIYICPDACYTVYIYIWRLLTFFFL